MRLEIDLTPAEFDQVILELCTLLLQVGVDEQPSMALILNRLLSAAVRPEQKWIDDDEKRER